MNELPPPREYELMVHRGVIKILSFSVAGNGFSFLYIP